MNLIDIPGIVIAAPILAVEFQYWGISFEKRGVRVKKIEAWLILLLLIFLAVRLFTTWGVMRY